MRTAHHPRRDAKPRRGEPPRWNRSPQARAPAWGLRGTPRNDEARREGRATVNALIANGKDWRARRDSNS
jgi:hypothetical protein